MIVSLLALTALAHQKSADLPIQIVPTSQNQFERKVNILESKGGTPGIYLFNDLAVSDKALEAIVKNPKSVQIAMLIMPTENGTIKAWLPNGAPADPTPLNLPKLDEKRFPTGLVAAVVDYGFMMQMPQGPNDPPNIGANIVGSAGAATIAGRTLRSIQPIGVPQFKYADLRVNFRVVQFIGSIPKGANSKQTVEDVTFTVGELVPDAKDKRDHLIVTQSDVPNVGNFSLSPTIDWAALEKDLGPVRNHNSQGRSQIVTTDGVRPDKDFKVNVSSNIAYKYWSGINVYRASNVQGYFGHIALMPN